MRIGILSDTHNLLRPEALAHLRGCDHILHAGDVCDAAVLDTLESIAPVTAVRGNNDQGPWAQTLPRTALVRLGGALFYLVHDIADIDIDPAAVGVRVVVTGHSHRPAQEERDGVLYLNPGSAGPRRFRLPISAAEVQVADGAILAAHTTVLVPDGR